MKVRLGQFSFNISLLPLQQPITMAERQPEEEERKCTLCPNAYKSAKALLFHLRGKHADDPLLQEAIKSVRKDTCPFCGEGRANLVEHKRCCAGNPDVQKRAARKVVPPTPVVQPTQGTPPPADKHLQDIEREALRTHPECLFQKLEEEGRRQGN